MITAPSNNIIVKVKTKWAKHFGDIAKRAALENGSSIDPADAVNIVGEIVSLPKYISPLSEYKGFSVKDMKIGDTAIFSYRVICDMLPSETDEVQYKNLLTFEGEEYFLADVKNIFAVIRDNEIIMVNGWVMLGEYTETKLILPASVKKTRNATSSEILHINHSRTHLSPIKAEPGDIVFYDSKKAQHYEMNGKKFLILPQEKILGKSRQ